MLCFVLFCFVFCIEKGPCPLFWLIPTRWGMSLEDGLRPQITMKGKIAFETISATSPGNDKGKSLDGCVVSCSVHH
jgi:hypothetical protein